MKRTRLKRSSPEQIAEWQRRSTLRARENARDRHTHKYRRIGRNSKRTRERRERDFGEKAKWARQRRCDACGAPPPNDPHHHPTRAAGGTAKDISTLCRPCHRLYHDQGAETFQGITGLDLVENNARVDREWRER